MDYYGFPTFREAAFLLPPLLWFREASLRVMESRLPASPRKILDVGCGTGFTTRRLARRFQGAEVVGVDLSPSMIRAARRSSSFPGIRFEVQDIRNLQGRFDLVVAFYVWMLLPEGDLTSLRHLLAPGGEALLVLTSPTLFTRLHRAFYRITGGGNLLLRSPRWWACQARDQGFAPEVVPIHALEGSFLLHLRG